MMLRTLLASAVLAGHIVAADQLLGFNQAPEVETRSLDQIYRAALAEGGVVTVWQGGDEHTGEASLKQAFESRFPGMTLNVTINLSKYHDTHFDQQLAANNVYIDSIILQTVHDFPRWKEEGALLHYAPAGFDKLYESARDIHAAFYSIMTIAWAGVWNEDKLSGLEKGPVEWEDWLRPEFKDKLVLTYPNDDDAVLYAFDLILQQYGEAWFDRLLAQNPRWVRGTATPRTVLKDPKSQWAATFTTSALRPSTNPNLNVSHPVEGSFVSWFQLAAIPKDAPHPEGAKLLHNWFLSQEHQAAGTFWPVRTDMDPPKGFPPLMEMPGTNVTYFREWMADRAHVERLRFYFEDKIGTAQGLTPLEDGI